ncbi:MAG TPA: cytochrome c oxidase subunit 2A [Bacillota bacterium]|nr:cytochrome c oxidase subunit 2A [Bacillota bacterium]
MEDINKVPQTDAKEDDHALKGSLVSVMILGIIIIISWAGVWMLFLSR